MGKLIILILYSTVSFVCAAQNTLGLQIIDDYPIKIDGGCNFFSHANEKLVDQKYIYVVSGSGIGFFKVKGKFIYVNRVERKKKANGYTDRFSGSGYKIDLDVTKLRKTGAMTAEVTGVMKIQNGVMKEELKIHGVNEDGTL